MEEDEGRNKDDKACAGQRTGGESFSSFLISVLSASPPRSHFPPVLLLVLETFRASSSQPVSWSSFSRAAYDFSMIAVIVWAPVRVAYRLDAWKKIDTKVKQ